MARFHVWVSPSPAISRCLKARLYGWLPLSNAYGISSVATQHKIKRLRHFFRCNTTQDQTPTAFSFIKNKTRSAEFPASSTISHKLCKNIALKTPNNLCCFRCHYSELAYMLVLFMERMLLIIRQKEPAMWLASLK